MRPSHTRFPGPRPTLIIMNTTSVRLAARSRRQPDALIVDARGEKLARDGAVVKATRVVIAFIVALAARPGSVVSGEEILDLALGDRPDGGVDYPVQAVNKLVTRASPILAALGYRIETDKTHGRWVRCCLSAVPRTYSELNCDLETIHG